MNSKRVALFVLICLIVVAAAFGAMACSNLTLSTKHTVIFNVQYDSEWTAYASIRTRGAAILDFPDDPTKENYVFAGWYVDSLFTREGHEYDYEDKELTEDVNYYAKFVPASSITNPYTITFNTNKGSAVASQDINFGGVIDATKIATTRPGFAFEGWYLEPEFHNQWIVEYDRVWKSRTLYAKWYSTGYIITYELDGGTNHKSNPSVYKFEDGLTLEDPTKLGYNFLGWYLDAEFTIPFSSETLYDDNLTIYAKWSDPIVYTISYTPGEGESLSGEMPTEYTVLDNPLELPTVSKTGYDFTGWITDTGEGKLFDETKTYAENLTLTPSLTEHKYMITYYLDGGVNNSSNKSYVTYFNNVVILQNPTKKGYTFAGWYSDSGLSESFASGTAITEDISLYATWNITTYTITYHLSGATCDTSFNSYNILDNPLSLPTPSKSDLYFGGWYLDSELIEMFDATNEYAENLNLYPKFVSNEMLLPENYFKTASSQAIYLPYVYILTLEKNLCIPLNESKAVKGVALDGTSVSSAAFIYSPEEDILVIKSEVFTQKDEYNKYYIEEGNKYFLTVTFLDDSIKTYCLSLVDGNVQIGDTSYIKGTSTCLEAPIENIVLDSDRVYNVSIDGFVVEYTVDGNNVVVSDTIMNKYTTGIHLLEITTDQGVLTKDFVVANTTEYTPYNIKVDIDSDPGNVWILWDNDFDEAVMKVRIGSNEYTETSHPSLFDGNKFNATGLLTTSNQTFVVSSFINEGNYPSANYTFKYNMTSTAITKYLTNDIVVYGKTMNRFITSWEELYDILFYTCLRFNELDAFDAPYTDYGVLDLCFDINLSEAYQIDYTYSRYAAISAPDRKLTNGNFITALVFETLSNMPEALPCSLLRLALNDGPITNQTYELGFKYLGDVKSTTDRDPDVIDTGAWKDNEHFPEIYGKNNSDFATFPIESNNKGNATVYSSVELYQALEHGYNPVIPSGNTALVALYNEMKTVLRAIVDENMNDYQKVAAIYQWLATSVLYDHNAANETIPLETAAKADGATAEEKQAYYDTFGWSCFYMEGVFMQRMAVCNGIADAFSAMCNMLGIQCYKLTGSATDSDDNTVQHAWNTVCIYGTWYISDATWGSTAVNSWEILTYKYLFMNEREAVDVNKHIAKPTPYGITYAQDYDIEKFKVMKFTYSATTYDFTVANQDDFDRLFNYAISKKGTPTSGEVVVIEGKTTGSKSIYSYANITKYTLSYHVYTLKNRSDIAILVKR